MARLIKVCAWSGSLRASVIFVHGLGGNAYDTWRASGPDSFWPVWLGEDVDGLAVYTLAYEAPPTNWLGTAMPLQDRVVNVLETLLGEPELRQGPIAFICHSLGGLIVKQLMLDLQQQQARRPGAADLLARVTQIVFIATPHTGSRQGTLLDWLRFIAWPTPIARTLVANDPTLRAVNVAYRGLADERRGRLTHRIFYETAGTPAGVIVDEASADPGLPGDPPVPVDADHLTIVKPFDRSSLVYACTRDFIAQTPLPPSVEGAVGPSFEALPLPALRVETPRNIVPKLLRIASIGLVGLVAYKGVVALVTPTTPVTRKEFDAYRRQGEETNALVKKIAERLVANSAAAATTPNVEKTVEAAVAATVAGAASGDARMQRALDLLKENRTSEAQNILREFAALQEQASQRAARAAAEQSETAKHDAQQAAAAYRHLGAIAGLHDPKAAREAYAKAVALDPLNAAGLEANAWFQLVTLNLAEAEKSFRALLAAQTYGADADTSFWAHIGIGSVNEYRGELDEALASFHRAELAAPTSDADFYRSVALLKTGGVLMRQNKVSDAQSNFQRALEIAKNGLARAPGDVDWRSTLSMTYSATAHAALVSGDLDAALQLYSAGRESLRRVLESDPGNVAFQSGLIGFETSIGDVLATQQRYADAMRSYDDALTATRKLVANDADNASYQHQLAQLYGKMGDLKANQKRWDEAVADYRRNSEIAEALAKTDWGNTDLRNAYALSSMRLASNEVLAGHSQAALNAMHKARSIYAGLASEHPQDDLWRRQLATVDKALARLQPQLKDDSAKPAASRESKKRR